LRGAHLWVRTQRLLCVRALQENVPTLRRTGIVLYFRPLLFRRRGRVVVLCARS
jgi:hypothetical protein